MTSNKCEKCKDKPTPCNMCVRCTVARLDRIDAAIVASAAWQGIEPENIIDGFRDMGTEWAHLSPPTVRPATVANVKAEFDDVVSAALDECKITDPDARAAMLSAFTVSYLAEVHR